MVRTSFGIAVLIAAAAGCSAQLHPGDDEQSVAAPLVSGRGVEAFVVVDGAMIWLTSDEGSVLRMDPDSNEVETLASGFVNAQQPQLKVAGGRAFYTTSDGIWSVALYGEHVPTQHVRRFASHTYPWTVDGEYIYYVPDFQSSRVRRVRIADGADALFFQLGPASAVRALAFSEEHVFIEVQTSGVAETEVIVANKRDGSIAMAL